MDHPVPTHDSRVVLKAFIGQGNVVRHEDEGSRKLGDIYMRMPSQFDFIVAEFAGKIYAIDMDVTGVSPSATILPQRWTIHDDLDAAIMATVLMSDRPIRSRPTGLRGSLGPTGPVGTTGPRNVHPQAGMPSKTKP